MPLEEGPNLDLLINVLEDKVRWLSGHTFMRYAPADWKENGYRTITWSQYNDAINKVAYWLDEKLGKSTNNQTVAYLGPNDPRYAIILPAVIKTNRKVRLCYTTPQHRDVHGACFGAYDTEHPFRFSFQTVA
jgi:acyl-CoA synthetase (AMP-forming)/AMP-acid ligase II